jgi:hypothetical protein
VGNLKQCSAETVETLVIINVMTKLENLRKGNLNIREKIRKLRTWKEGQKKTFRHCLRE